MGGSMAVKLIFIIGSIAITPLILLVVAFGQSEIAVITFYPYNELAMRIFGLGTQPSRIFTPLLFLQYPTYGFVIGYAFESVLCRRWAICLVSCHVLAALACIALGPAT